MGGCKSSNKAAGQYDTEERARNVGMEVKSGKVFTKELTKELEQRENAKIDVSIRFDGEVVTHNVGRWQSIQTSLKRDGCALKKVMHGQEEITALSIRWEELSLVEGAVIDVEWGPLFVGLCEGHTEEVTCVASLSDGRVASGSSDKTVRIWGPGGRCHHILTDHSGPIKAVEGLSDGRIVSAGSMSAPPDGETVHGVCVWNADGEFQTILKGHTAMVNSVVKTPLGQIITCAKDHDVRVWSYEGKCRTQLVGHRRAVKGCMGLSDGRVASWSGDNTVRMWNKKLDMSCTRAFQGDGENDEAHRQGITCLLELDEGRMATGARDATIRLWSKDERFEKVLEGHEGPITSLIALKDGRLVSSSKDMTIRIWSAEGECQSILNGHTDKIREVVDLGDGRIASASADKTVRIWSTTSVAAIET